MQCYSCAHIETGELPLIPGFENPTTGTDCKYGTKPNDKYLIDCSEHDDVSEPGIKITRACVSMKIDGISLQNSDQFNGTLRGCATRRAATDPPEINTQSYNIFRQGQLLMVSLNFPEPTGEEVLVNLTKLFDENLTRVKFQACNAPCFELEQGNGTSTEATSSTTTESGAPLLHPGSFITIWVFSVVLQYI